MSSFLDFLPLVGDAINFGSGIASNAMNRRTMRETNAFNAAEAEKNRQFQSQEAQMARDWQEQQYNLYSSPSAMVRQYNEAGLNPALMYGQNLQSSTGSSPSPIGSSASGVALPSNVVSLGNVVQNFLGLSRLKQEISESKAREASFYASAQKNYSAIRVDAASIRQMSIQNEQMLNSIQNDNKRVTNETRHINAILTQISASNKVSSKQVEQIDAAIKRMAVQNALDEQQKLTLCAQQVFLEFQAEESGLRQHEILSKVRLNNSQVNAMSETLFEQRFKNKYLSLYGRYPNAESVTEARNWAVKQGKYFESYE